MGLAWKRPLIATGLLLSLGLAPPVMAETPPDMLVVGGRIDDIITLDPAEVFEFNGAEVSANIYDRIMMYEPENLTELVGGVVESWEISDDGKTITFTMRPDLTFHSGNPVRPDDAVYSLKRVVKLNKTPSFIVTQFGWTEDNVDELIEVVDENRFRITITEDFSPGLVLNALSATIGSVVDEQVVEANAVDGDMGYDWLKNHSAGSGAFELVTWNANETVVMESNPDYRHGAPAMQRVVIRHVPEPAAQRLLLENGDIDIARTLTPDQIAGLAGNDDIVVTDHPKATLYYVAANVAVEELSDPRVWEAMKYLIDYDGMEETFLQGQFVQHQSFWPKGTWASADAMPYTLDVEKAKALLAEAGYPEGFELQIDSLNTAPFMDMAQSVQSTLAQGGIRTEIIPQDGSALWPKYRARRHQLILARWGPDYLDPHSNADSFASNPDNSEEAGLTGVLAWRNAWADDEITEMTAAARSELDLERRKEIYEELQLLHQVRSPFAIMFQQNEQVASRSNVEGFVSGPVFDLVYYRNVTK